MENNTKLSQQMTGLYATIHKWEGILAGFKVFALANDGVVNVEEKAQIDRLQGEIDAIKARIVQISSKKGIVLEQVGITTTPPSSQETIAADGPMGLPEDVGIGEFAQVLVAWCVELDEKLVEIKKNLGTVKLSDDGRIALSKKFTSTIPVIQEFKKAIDAKIGGMTTIREVCDLLIAELANYNTTKLAENHFKKNKGAYLSVKMKPYSISPTPEQIKATLDAAVDKDDAKKLENKNEFIAAYDTWRNEMLKELNQWTPIFGQCTLVESITRFDDYFKDGSAMDLAFLAEIKALTSKAPIKYMDFSASLKSLLEDKFTTTWAESIYQKDVYFLMHKPSKIIGFINSCIHSNDLRTCAESETLQGLAAKQPDYQNFLSDFKKYKEALKADIMAVKVGNPKALEDTLIVDVALFYDNFSQAVGSSYKTASPMIEAMKRVIYQQLNVKTANIGQTKKTLTNWIDLDHDKATWLPEQYFLWKSNPAPFPSTAGIASAIHSAYIDIDARKLAAKFAAWTPTIKGALSANPFFELDQKMLMQNLNNLFFKGDSFGQDSSFISHLLASNLPKSNSAGCFTQSKFDECAWQPMLKTLNDSAYIDTLFNQLLTKYGPKALEQYVLDTSALPVLTEIQKALKLSPCHIEKLEKPKSPLPKLPVNFKLVLINPAKGDHDAFVGGTLSVPLEYIVNNVEVKGVIKQRIFVKPIVEGITFEKEQNKIGVEFNNAHLIKDFHQFDHWTGHSLVELNLTVFDGDSSSSTEKSISGGYGPISGSIGSSESQNTPGAAYKIKLILKIDVENPMDVTVTVKSSIELKENKAGLKESLTIENKPITLKPELKYK